MALTAKVLVAVVGVPYPLVLLAVAVVVRVFE
jgi:hypothetical protein